MSTTTTENISHVTSTVNSDVSYVFAWAYIIPCVNYSVRVDENDYIKDADTGSSVNKYENINKQDKLNCLCFYV